MSSRPPIEVGSPPRIQPLIVSAELVPERAGVVSFLSNQTRQGDWTLARHFRVADFMGNVELDLTRARVGAGTSHIEIMAFMSNVTILVPLELRVDCSGAPFMGNFELQSKLQGTISPDAPVIRVTGTAFMSNVTVQVVDPNAPGWLDKLRARLKK